MTSSPPSIERMRALCRMLIDSGDLTPQGERLILSLFGEDDER